MTIRNAVNADFCCMYVFGVQQESFYFAVYGKGGENVSNGYSFDYRICLACERF